jgi:hypothetical protein
MRHRRAPELIILFYRLGSGSNDAQTVKAGVNRVQFIFLIAPIRLSNTPVVSWTVSKPGVSRPQRWGDKVEVPAYRMGGFWRCRASELDDWLRVKSNGRAIQRGSLIREERKAGPDDWIFRWRKQRPEGRVKRKVVVGTVDRQTRRVAYGVIRSQRC